MRWLAWLVVMVLATGARADEAANREEARRSFEAGQAADRQRDWQTAIDHYLRANDLVPHPNTIYNIATNYERLGKLREAGVWYGKYLDAAPDSPDRDRVVKQLRELRDRRGTLTVRSQPTGARVIIDGKLQGATPYSDHIAGGRHRVELELDGVREERAINVEFGEPVILDVTLRGKHKAKTGTLRVVGAPPGALVSVDTFPAGQLPLTMPVTAGVHRIRVTADGYTAFDTSATVEPDREVVVEAQLTRALGTFGESKPTPSRVGYLFGAAGGVDAGGEGALYLFELGVRSPAWDASIRIGDTVGLFAIDLMVRWNMTQRRVVPFLAAAYTVLRDQENDDREAHGYLFGGGVRFDLSRGEHATWSLVAESGVRIFQEVDSPPGAATQEQTRFIVPVMTSLQLQYK